MIYVLLGLILLLVLLLLGRRAQRVDPAKAARNIKLIGGWSLVGAGALLSLTGRFTLGLPLVLFGLGLLGMRLPLPVGGGNPRGPYNPHRSQGKASSVRTELVEMTLDHDTGAMDGQVLRGNFQGRTLSSLNEDELLSLHREARTSDGQSAKLVEAYLDRTMPDWQQRPGASQSEPGGDAGGGTMTAAEAYRILGLWPGAKPDEIRQAHRELMKKFHPDQGGSTYLATKINEAKDTLLREKGVS
jgi:DnaJ-domain-containing protein 1